MPVFYASHQIICGVFDKRHIVEVAFDVLFSWITLVPLNPWCTFGLVDWFSENRRRVSLTLRKGDAQNLRKLYLTPHDGNTVLVLGKSRAHK
jgi:hypothetical protein